MVGGRRADGVEDLAGIDALEIRRSGSEDGVEGTIAFPGPTVSSVVEIRDLELTFAGGVVVDAKAAKGRDFVERLLDTDPGARRVGELGVGTDAALRTMTGDLLIDEKVLGSVHIALGRAYPECGGVNRSAIHWEIVRDLRGGGSFSCDDVGLVRDGVIQDALSSAAVARS